jgi:hypothetical protein
MSSSKTGALSAAVIWREVLEEVKSSTRFLFLSTPVSSESAAGGDVVELVLLLILWHHLHPNFLQPRGLQIQKRLDQPEEALPLEEEGVIRGIGGPAHEQVSRVTETKRHIARNK